jgi:hypothetical protein
MVLHYRKKNCTQNTQNKTNAERARPNTQNRETYDTNKYNLQKPKSKKKE